MPNTVLPSSPAPGARRDGRVKALPDQMRQHNRSLVLTALFHDGAMSRADLARTTGLTRVTVSALVGDLVTAGLVQEQGAREASGPGKPAVVVDLDRTGLMVVGVDLSAAHEVRGAVLDLAGAVVHRAAVDRPADGDADGTLATLESLIDDLRAAATGRVIGIGVGTPGVVSDEGVVVASPDIGWHDLPLQENLRIRTGLPVYVANDADVAVLAERTLGGASENFMLLKIDRGVGGGVVVSGELARGSRHAAGEVGHVTVGTDGGRECACGRIGCLETWASVRAIETRIAAGEPAEHVLREAGERLSIAIAPVVGALDLSEIVLSGPAARLDGLMRTTAERTLRDRVFLHDDVQVRMSALGEDVVLLGANAMLLHGELGIT